MKSVLIPLADGFEEMEAVIVIDVLRRAEIDVVTAGLAEGPVKAARGTVLQPDTTLNDVLDQRFDMIVLPGGMPGVTNLREDPRIKQLLARFQEDGGYTAAICAAPSILADFGYLKGKQATSNPKFKGQVAIVDVDYREDPVVEDGGLITSRGPGTSIPFALAIVEKLMGRKKRETVEAGLVLPAAAAS